MGGKRKGGPRVAQDPPATLQPTATSSGEKKRVTKTSEKAIAPKNKAKVVMMRAPAKSHRSVTIFYYWILPRKVQMALQEEAPRLWGERADDVLERMKRLLCLVKEKGLDEARQLLPELERDICPFLATIYAEDVKLLRVQSSARLSESQLDDADGELEVIRTSMQREEWYFVTQRAVRLQSFINTHSKCG